MRRVPRGGAWHRATDHLKGTQEYGKPGSETSNREFSIRFDNLLFNQFLFASGKIRIEKLNVIMKYFLTTSDTFLSYHVRNTSKKRRSNF